MVSGRSQPEALAALQATPEPAPRAVTAAKLVAVTRLPAADAVPLLQGIRTAAGDPVHRAAALRALLEIDAVNAPATTVAVLGGDDWAMKQVALESLYASRAPGLAAALLGSLIYSVLMVIVDAALRGMRWR